MPKNNHKNNPPPDPVSVILIAHNEVETIEKDVEDFYRVVVEKLPGSELIVTEDGSTDGTSELLREIATRLPVKLIQSVERKGYIPALLDAIELSSQEWILFSDTGGKFAPDDFWRLQERRSDSDLIIGVKVERGDQVYRQVMTRIFNMLIRYYFRIPVRDIDSGLRLFRRDIFINAISEPLLLKDMIATELTLRMFALGARLGEVPVVYSSRQGKSRGMPPKKIPRVIVHVLSSFPRLKDDMYRLRGLAHSDEGS
ncbi:MAG TPA: glycosyltransferase family 2 protein [Proteobacteria bacterium]|nr:glycosyltransferase family 2 protein [Pseudomonadota bacterium]